MKLQFKYQQFQADAVDSVCDVFLGQPFSRPQFLIDQGNKANSQQQLASDELVNGWCNADLDKTFNGDRQLLNNIRKVQQRNGIPMLHDHIDRSLNGKMALTIEMETGTGKTYTYIKTVFELNKRYGWSKFIVVVPSVAIREGVYKTFQITGDHFADEYEGKRCKFFIYNSAHTSEIRAFSADGGINVMIVNVQAFNARGADARRIYRELDSFNGVRPIDSIAATHPIVIIDEPQSVLGKKARESLKDFKALFYLLYSATHRENFNKIYRLDAVDAYQRKLVKKIGVKGIEKVGDRASSGYLYLERINTSSNSNPTATVMLEYSAADGSGKLTKRTHKLRVGDDVYNYSGEIESYRHGYQISNIDAAQGIVEFTGNFSMREGGVVGETNEDDIRRLQIVETIKSHLECERSLYSQGIKVLSLFFVDEVAKYKSYDEHGLVLDGVYARVFQQEYAKQVDKLLAELDQTNEDPNYAAYLRRWKVAGCRVDAGYFSIDKKGHAVDSKSKRGEGSDDQSAYDLIMKDKERLLSFDEPVRFIFSHSALREGWDNPNVFQICTLGNPGGNSSEIKKRQEIGRGLRLAVDQNGVRQDADVLGEDRVQAINRLTVVANESYDSFARGLQDEYAEVLKLRPSRFEFELVQNYHFVDGDNKSVNLSLSDRAEIFSNINGSTLVEDGAITEKYSNMIHMEKVAAVSGVLPDRYSNIAESMVDLLNSIADGRVLKPENARSTVHMTLRREIVNRPEFQELWNHINQKTYYQVDMNEPDMIACCVRELNQKLAVTRLRLAVKSGEMENVSMVAEGQAMTMAKSQLQNEVEVDDSDVEFDLLGEIASQTDLTRSTVATILSKIDETRFKMFRVNPEEFIRKCIVIINDAKSTMLSNSVKYYPLRNERMDFNKVFIKNIDATPSSMCQDAIKHIYDKVRFDSDVESRLARAMDTDEQIDFYIKLPSKYTIHTPVGEYNPDWAIVAKSTHDVTKHVYLVAESKGSIMPGDLRGVERAKIECARRHFAAISDGIVNYDVVSGIDNIHHMIDQSE